MNLTKPQIETVGLVFEDRLSTQGIAKKLSVDIRTIQRWEKLPEFVSLLKKYKDDFIESSTNQFLSDRRYRLACKMDRHRHICRVIKQRAVDAAPDVPANPWIMDPLHHPLCEYELKEGEKLIQKALRPAS